MEQPARRARSDSAAITASLARKLTCAFCISDPDNHHDVGVTLVAQCTWVHKDLRRFGGESALEKGQNLYPAQHLGKHGMVEARP